jgi:hypothetical protein
VLIVVAVAGYRVWVSLRDQRAESAGDRYYAASRLFETEGPEAAEAAFAALMAEGVGGYPTLAAFNLASIRAETGDIAGAVAALDAIALDPAVDASLKDLARYRAALLLVDTAPLDEIRQRLEPMVAEESAFRYLALEALALTAIRVDDLEGAINWLTLIAIDPNAPDANKNRAARLYGVIASRPGAPVAEALPPAPPGNPQFLAPEPTVAPPTIDGPQAPIGLRRAPAEGDALTPVLPPIDFRIPFAAP